MASSQADTVSVVQATLADALPVSQLFDGYRQFYRQPSDIDAAQQFITARLQQQDSAIFIATHGDQPAGFVQLYPSFSSVGMARIFILNDLFVSPTVRGQGVATALLNCASEFAKESDAKRLDLATALDNSNAQALYEKLGWKKNTSYFHYSLAIDEQ